MNISSCAASPPPKPSPIKGEGQELRHGQEYDEGGVKTQAGIWWERSK